MPTYVIFKGSYGKVYARNCETGKVEFSSYDASAVVQWAVDASLVRRRAAGYL